MRQVEVTTTTVYDYATDRRVHARLPDGTEVVRYDRAGKWYLEHPELPNRRHVTLQEAVEAVGELGTVVYLKTIGGNRFDELETLRFGGVGSEGADDE